MSQSTPEKDHSTSPVHEDKEMPPKTSCPELSDGQKVDLERDDKEMALRTTKSLEQKVSLPREVLVIGLISLAQFTTQMALGQCLSILHIIGDHFGITNPGTLSWIIAGYSLTVGTFILFSGRLGDIFGWKRMLVIGYVWFAIWSIVAGLAYYSNHVLFIFARIFQGIGPAMCLPNGLALLGALYNQGRRKNMAFAVFGATAPGGCICGALFGGIWSLTWWPWTFLSFGIVLLIIAFIASIAIPDPQDDKPGLLGRSLRQALADLDLLGATIGITALILFNFAWNQAPTVGWDKAYIIITLVLGTALFPAFLWVEFRLAETPLIPMDVFTSDNAFVLGCVSLGWANFGIWLYYLWQILETLRGTPPLLAVAYLSPLAVFGALAAITTGILLARLKPAWIMIIAMCAFLTGTVLVATLPVYQVYWAQIFVCTIIACFGMDMSFPSATLVVSNAVDKAHQGVAASLVNTIVNYSISLGLGIAGTIEIHVNNGGHTFSDTLRGYRGALYLGIGLAGSGVCLAIVFLLKCYHEDLRHRSTKAQNTGTEDKRPST